MPRRCSSSMRIAQVVGAAVARGRREVTADLVAPRAGERMLHHGQQLDVGESHASHVVAEHRRHLAIGERAIALFEHAPPGAEMNLVDRDGAFDPFAPRPLRKPVCVVEFVARLVNDRGRRGGRFHPLREGIAFHQQAAAARANFVLVIDSRADAGNEQLPHARAAERTHHVDPPVPAVEIADHADAGRVGRPHRERHAADACHLADVRAELVVRTVVLLLAPQIKIERRRASA